MASWRLVVQDRVSRLEAAIASVARDADLEQVRSGIDQANRAARLDGSASNPMKWLGQWVTGSAIELAWRGLHRAEEQFVLEADEDWLLARLEQTQETLRTLGINAAGATTAQAAVLEMKSKRLGPDDRKHLKATLESLNARSDNYHSDLRTVRNILVLITGLLVLGLVVLTLAGALDPQTFSLCGVPTRTGCTSPSIFSVEIAGGFGGLLSAVVFLNNLAGQNTPYGIWLYQGLLKTPTGAALAVIVVFLIQSGLIGFLKPDPGYIIPYAMVFGFAQQAATQVVDNWAGNAVKKTTSTATTSKRTGSAQKTPAQ